MERRRSETDAGRAAPAGRPTLTAIVPVYNERYLVRRLIERLLAADLPSVRELEVVAVDDGSTDGSREILRELAAAHDNLRLLLHETNQGKGAALRTGIAAATGDLAVIQDADLEYDPRDLELLVRPFIEDGADVVYGSRFQTRSRRRVLYFRHQLANGLITLLSNLFTDLNFSDVETCYKMFRTELLKSLPLRSNGFAIEVELTAKIAKRRFAAFEVPISYLGRTYQEGKKITWRDGVRALGAILKYWLVDDLYKDDAYGGAILHALERARRFTGWMADAIAPSVGDRVLEIGAGIGNITTCLVPREEYVASDINPDYLHYLGNLGSGKPYLEVARVDAGDAGDFVGLEERFDTVVCLNVLEHVPDPAATLQNLRSALEPGGRLVLYVPQGPRLFSSLDRALEHRCRYARAQLLEELEEAGFTVESCRDFNRAGMPGWWWNGRVLERTGFGRVQLKIFNALVPVLRVVDRLLPWKGLGLITVARRSDPARDPDPAPRRGAEGE